MVDVNIRNPSERKKEPDKTEIGEKESYEPPTGKRGLPVTNCKNARCSSISKLIIISNNHLTARLFRL